WLAAWSRRHPRALTEVAQELSGRADPAPIRFLRTRSSYLDLLPGLSLGTPWAFAGIYLQKIFLNWVVLLPLLLFATLLPQFVIRDPAMPTFMMIVNLVPPGWLEWVLGPAARQVLRASAIFVQLQSFVGLSVLCRAYPVARDYLPRLAQGHL